MSRDWHTVVIQRRPAALAWVPGQPVTSETAERLLNAPVAKYLIGLGWWLRGYSTADLTTNWSWRAAWEVNARAGGLPGAGVLVASRSFGAVLGALATLPMFWIGKKAGGAVVGLTAALLLGLHPLILLHTRRAMAEGPMIFFTLLALWGILRLARSWDSFTDIRLKLFGDGALVGFLAGLAMASKQTSLILFFVALLASGLALMARPWSLSRRLGALTGAWLTIGSVGGLTFLTLNPIMYRQPLRVARAMIDLRAAVVELQVRPNTNDDGMILSTLPVRAQAIFRQVYLQPPAVWDLPLYLDQLQPQAEAYFASPVNRLLRQPVANFLLIGFSAVGGAASGARLIRDRGRSATRVEQTIWLWSAATLGLSLVAIPINWQRYFLPLVPPVCLCAALGLNWMLSVVTARQRTIS